MPDSPTNIETGEEAMPGVQAIQELFQTLNESAVRYCHWKSNLRLLSGLYGRTDLDLLVDPANSQTFRQILAEHDIKRMLAPPGKRYPGLEDYLGMDQNSGRLFHLHVHYRLVLGEQFVKNYGLPLEQVFLNSTYNHYGVMIPTPELELIVLVIRALLKYRDRDVVKDVLNIRSPGIPIHIMAEFHWLLEQTSIREVAAVLDDLAGVLPVPAHLIIKFLNVITVNARSGRELLGLRQEVRRALAGQQRLNRLGATLTYFQELWRRRNSFLRFRPTQKMTWPDGGLLVALIGIDGAGKTTLCHELVEWLGEKTEVTFYYLGSKQPSLTTKWSYPVFRASRRGHRVIANQVGERNPISKAAAAVRDTLLYSHYLLTGYDRYRRYVAGKQRAAQGAIVVFDRYPLEAPLDGPQIRILAKDKHGRLSGRLGRVFARLEQRLYRKIPMPDLLFVLELAPDISLLRKPDHDRQAIEEKHVVLHRLLSRIKAEANLRYVMTIDATFPKDEVLQQIKEALWGVVGRP